MIRIAALRRPKSPAGRIGWLAVDRHWIVNGGRDTERVEMSLGALTIGCANHVLVKDVLRPAPASRWAH